MERDSAARPDPDPVDDRRAGARVREPQPAGPLHEDGHAGRHQVPEEVLLGPRREQALTRGAGQKARVRAQERALGHDRHCECVLCDGDPGLRAAADGCARADRRGLCAALRHLLSPEAAQQNGRVAAGGGGGYDAQEVYLDRWWRRTTEPACCGCGE